MIRPYLADLVAKTLNTLVQSGDIPPADYGPIEIADPRNPEHGDFSCNIALTNAKSAGLAPRLFAEKLKERLSDDDAVSSIDIAGPGFLNFRVQPAFFATFVNKVVSKGVSYARTTSSRPQSINVEFVSVNPNGPITVGSGRGAAFGDTLARVLEHAGNHVSREFYINDGVNSEQMRLFAESVLHYYRELVGQPSTMPENGYKGDYVADVAREIFNSERDGKKNEPLDWFRERAQELMIERQKKDLGEFGVTFDTWFSEQSLHESGDVARTLAELKQRGVAYEKDGALWLNSSEYGDDKDRVLVREDGRPTYIASDIAYHRNKFQRGFDKLIDVWGPDHHGYIPRMNAAIECSGFPLTRFEVVIFQIVRFVKDGQPAPMRKRDGNIYELRDLVNDVGSDVARFFYLMRSHDTHMDFDIDLATKQSDENPVFYVQYAHARICSVLRKASELGIDVPTGIEDCLDQLTNPKEIALAKKILDLPYEVVRVAEDYGIHRLTTFAVELARAYHHFYDECRVLQPEHPKLTKARLGLCLATKIALAANFNLLGISSPETM